MTIFNRFLMILGLFISFNLNAFCQEDDEEDANDKIAEQLRQMYDDAAHFDDVFFVKKDGVWEFANEYGKILTNMRIESVEVAYVSAELTIKGKKYTVYSPFEDDRVLMGRYGYYAYMDKNGNAVTPYMYDSDGDKINITPEKASAIINTSDQVMKVYQEVEQGRYTSVKALEKSISLDQAEKFTSDVADSLLTLLCKTHEKSPKNVDMKIAEDLFEATLANCGVLGNEIVLDYYETNGLDKQKRFDYVKELVDNYPTTHSHMLMGDFLAEGAICPKDIQGAINSYKTVVMNDSDEDGVAHDKLAELWKKYGTRYDNLVGKLCAENEKVEYFDDENIILTNGKQKMVVDDQQQVVLPKGDYEIVGYTGYVFFLLDDSSEYQLVKKGGEPLVNGKFDDYFILSLDMDEPQFVLKKNGKWGFYGADGKPVTSMIFDDYEPEMLDEPSLEINGEKYSVHSLFIDGMMVVDKEGAYGCIDTNGKVAVPLAYEQMKFTPKGNLVVLKGGKYGVIDRNGNELLPCKYDYMEYDEDEGKLKATIEDTVDI
ncbi:MAG: WG repeat-containing protein [Prevotella sp.]|nr:WG repeat-containing protein [Prevotella sp.]